ncbi:la-related protein 6-like [Penaeus chinensis]|uniref:la-related protein 6-like n=1 Tax=Penaeus chinensis TaxID=139456 RepID=UPI001FB5EA64|nr:la-related protein 6-like [Penaeus chinensis]
MSNSPQIGVSGNFAQDAWCREQGLPQSRGQAVLSWLIPCRAPPPFRRLPRGAASSGVAARAPPQRVMLSLLSRFVIGSEYEENLRESCDSCASSSSPEDTDEELLSPPMPVINIDPTELAEEAIDAQRRARDAKGDNSDSLEDISNDSAIEREAEPLPPPAIPGKDVCRCIVELVEYYLSDENLVKDMFLLKHVTKHREGYVSLKLLASYKKVKRLTKDWRVVAHALRSSNSLEMNPEETKARRRHGLPQELEEDTRPFRTIIATHIPKELANMNNIAEYFAKFGEMISLQVHKPGGRSLDEVRLVDRLHPGSAATVCALVEYEKVHCARQALRTIANSAEGEMRAVEIPRKKREMGSLLGIKSQMDNESCYFSASDASEPASPVYRTRHMRLMSPSSSLASSPSVSPIPQRRYGAAPSLSPESSPPSPYGRRRGPPTPCSSPEDSAAVRFLLSSDSFAPFPSRSDVPSSLPLPRRHVPARSVATPEPAWRRGVNSSSSSSPDGPATPLSPWLRRRVLARAGDGPGSSGLSSPSTSPALRRRDSPMPLPDNVERLPRGPDGTRGFARRPLLNAQA